MLSPYQSEAKQKGFGCSIAESNDIMSNPIRKLLVLLVSTILSSQGAHANERCASNLLGPSVSIKGLSKEGIERRLEKLGHDQEAKDVYQAFERLPRPGTPEWISIVNHIQNELDPINGKGYTEIDLRSYLPRDVFERFYDAFPVAHSFNLVKDVVSPEIGKVLFNAGSYSGHPFYHGEVVRHAFVNLNNWLFGVLRAALPVESNNPSQSDIRVSTEAGGTSAEYPHLDGNNITGTLLLVGEHGTQLLPEGRDGRILEAKNGILVLISGLYRARIFPGVEATWHISPPGSNATRRMILISRFGPLSG